MCELFRYEKFEYVPNWFTYVPDYQKVCLCYKRFVYVAKGQKRISLDARIFLSWYLNNLKIRPYKLLKVYKV